MSLADITNTPTKTQIETQNALLSRQNDIMSGILGCMSSSPKDIQIASWDYVADIVEKGNAGSVFSVGDCFLTSHDDFGGTYWRVLNINSGDIYDTDYHGDILVETMSFTSKTGARNDFSLKYKRYSTSTDYTTPVAGDVTEVRYIETSGSSFSYNASSGALTFGVALPKNTIAYVTGKINDVEYRTTLFGDGTTTVFTVQASVEGTATNLGSITQIIYVTTDWTYNAQTGVIHIGTDGYNMPFGDTVEIDVNTTKPSITLQTVQCLGTTFQFDADNVNFYLTSNLRQWLNASEAKANWFQKMSSADNAPTWATTQDGFLKGLDEGFKKHIKKCRKLTLLPNNMKSAYNNASTLLTTEKLFLLSLYEVNAGNNSGVAEGSIYSYYDQFTGSELNTARIKKVGTSAQIWWLRSPNASSSGSAYYITASGTTNNYVANAGYGVAPACLIG